MLYSPPCSDNFYESLEPQVLLGLEGILKTLYFTILTIFTSSKTNEFLLVKMPTNVGITTFIGIWHSSNFYTYKLSQLIFYYSLPYLLQFHRLLELLVSVDLRAFSKCGIFNFPSTTWLLNLKLAHNTITIKGKE